MARIMRPPTDGFDSTETGGDWYDGPPPPPGLYQGKIAKMLLTKVTSGDHKGEQRIMVVCEITEGKYKGAGVIRWLNFGEKGDPWINNFLRSLTDGSEAQYEGIRHAFWKVGFAVDDPDEKKRLPIIRIGKKTNPIGMKTSFMTRMRDERAEIVRFVTPVPEGDEEDYDDTETDVLDGSDDDGAETDTDSSGLDEFSEDTTENPSPETADDSDDDGDPWSIS